MGGDIGGGGGEAAVERRRPAMTTREWLESQHVAGLRVAAGASVAEGEAEGPRQRQTSHYIFAHRQ